MRRAAAAAIVSGWREHKHGKILEPSETDLGNGLTLISVPDGMEIVTEAEIPGAIPSQWMVSVGHVTDVRWTLDSMLSIVSVRDDTHVSLIVQAKLED